MPLTKSNQFCNVSGVTFTYGTTPTIVTLLEVEDVIRKFKGTELLWSGDAAPGPTRKKVVDRRRDVSIVGADMATFDSIPVGSLGTLVWIEEDFYNGVLAGAITHTIVNFSFHENDGGGKHNEVKKGTINGSAVWTLTAGVYVDPHTQVQA